MASYIVLMNWTDQGIKNVKDTVKRAKSFEGAIEKPVVNHLDYIILSEDMTS
jgi:uncharacterized protein with GYD domain